MRDEKKLDDLFEQGMQAIENGQSPQTVTDNLPEEADELGALISLAARVRETAHPQLSDTAINSTRKRLSDLADEMKPKNDPRPAFRWAWTFGLAGALTIFLCAFVALAGGAIWWMGPSQAHVATFADVSGVAEVASANSEDWHTAVVGETVRTGQRIRTGADGNVTLAFFEGTRSMLGPNTELTLTRVDGQWGDVLQVQLSQKTGTARYNVIPLHGAGAQFLVDTPSGSVAVHGTVFAVTVDEQGEALVSVDRGKVVVANADQQVALNAGQATRSKPNDAPQPAAFQFASNDTLAATDGDTWNVAGIPFDVTDETVVEGDPQVGQPVFVKGRILDNGKWVADLITSADESNAEFQLSGVVESINDGSITINGVTVLTDGATIQDADIKVGDTVLVVYAVQADGSWLATKITALDEDNDSSQVICTGANPQPKGQSLADQYGVSYDEIMGWFCQGFGFGEIDLAYGLSQETGMPVAEIFALRLQGLGWGEIKRRAQVTTTPTVTPALSATVTPTVQTTLTITPTPETALTVTPEGTQAACTGANPQPKGQALADQYGVSYDEIMGWFCQGFGFGEIDIAYSLSLQTGKPVADIFALRQSGLGWGEIKKLLEVDKFKEKDQDKDKDKDNGKDKNKP